MGNPRANTPQRFLDQWETFSGPLFDGPFTSDLELIKAIEAQEAALIAFRKRRPFSIQKLIALRREKSGGGQEHEVFVPDGAAEGSIVWKITRPGRWGLMRATPREYLRRLHRLDMNSGTRILVEGIAMGTSNKPLLVTTMAFVPGRHPAGMYLEGRLRAAGWEPIQDPDQMQTYRLKADGTLMRDAHPRNFVLTSEDYLVPIDVIFVGEGRFHTHVLHAADVLA